MGEYIKFQDERLKVGTCEDLYYVTYDQLLEMVQNGAEQAPHNLPPADYLANGFRYRFPFPNDDGTDFDKGVILYAPPDLLRDNEHERVCKSLAPKGGGYNINAFITCPMSPDADPKQFSVGPHPRVVEVVQQKAVDNCLWLVLRCPYCGAKWRIPPDAATEFVEYIRQKYAQDHSAHYYLTIADRIEAGYTTSL
ncbi:MAG TPA: hypothetical protein VM537_05555 [Anaerolineae bacterium]|nr:hypothetical protein [Anaerolineae bacterium]